MVITGLTRNQLYLTVPWVRIPPAPPNIDTLSSNGKACLFLHPKKCYNITAKGCAEQVLVARRSVFELYCRN